MIAPPSSPRHEYSIMGEVTYEPLEWPAGAYANTWCARSRVVQVEGGPAEYWVEYSRGKYTLIADPELELPTRTSRDLYELIVAANDHERALRAANNRA